MTSKVEIAPIREDELADLATLQKELIDEDPDLIKMGKLFRTISLDTNYHLLGARKEGHLIGSLTAIVCYDLFGKCLPYMIIENVIVAKDAQGQRVGTKLIKRAESIAREQSCRYIMLVSSAERTKAKKFYNALGYDSEQYRGFKKYL